MKTDRRDNGCGWFKTWTLDWFLLGYCWGAVRLVRFCVFFGRLFWSLYFLYVGPAVQLRGEIYLERADSCSYYCACHCTPSQSSSYHCFLSVIWEQSALVDEGQKNLFRLRPVRTAEAALISPSSWNAVLLLSRLRVRHEAIPYIAHSFY
jgi:hypothetical protein